MYKILIVSQSHICRNPRVLKEAVALSQAGYLVTVLTAIYSEQLFKEDCGLIHNTSIKYEFYSDLRKINIRSFTDRLIKKLASEMNALCFIETKFSLGYGADRLLKTCLHHNAELYIMHQELPLVVGCTLLRKKYKVVFDLEDWYSEDLLKQARKKRPIKLLKKSEKFALQQAATCYTTSIAMANELSHFYKTSRKPYVIYNSFNLINKVVNKISDNDPIRLYWFSQTIGPGRGIEFFIEGMSKSKFSWTLTLRGNIDEQYKYLLTNKASPKDELIFQPLLKNEEILNDLTKYDIGLSLEPNVPPNKNLTISNKFFHYMAGGLPVIASDTLGHKEIGLKHPEFIFLYENDDISSLTELLNTLGRTIANDLIKIRPIVAHIFDLHYSWRKESKKLVDIISNALHVQ